MRKVKTGSTLNGKKIVITDSWDKLTFTQYLRILKMQNDNIELISILSGVDYETVKNAKITGLDNLMYLTRFINTPPTFPDKPTHIGEYKLPLDSNGIFDIQFESLAQFEDMRQVLNKLEKGVYALTKSYATYCAIYVQKLRDGEYDGEKARQMVSEIMNYPASDIIVAGGFFFVRLQTLLNGIPTNSHNTAQHRKRVIGKRSRKNLVRMQRLTKRQGR